MSDALKTEAFHGAKVAILSGGHIVTLKRDDRHDIPWPGHWDLPGGGREGTETPEETVIREVREETGLRLMPDRLTYRADYDMPHEGIGVFFRAHWPGLQQSDLTLGDEGQSLILMPVAEFLSHPDAIPQFQVRLRQALS